MNKLLKGAVAGAAGVALLLGGAGTFALWNSTATVNVGSVASGTLSITAGATSWKNVASDVLLANQPISSIATYKIVPGDKLELTQLVTINATGDNLKAVLSIDEATITGTLKSSLAPIVVSATGTGVTAGAASNTFNVAPNASASTVTVKVTLELPSTVTGTTAQSSTLNLSALGVKLDQVRP